MIDDIHKEVIEEWFAYESLEEDEILSINYYDCVIQKQFGPYSIGDTVKLISVDYMSGLMLIYNQYCYELKNPDFSAKLTFNIVGIEE